MVNEAIISGIVADGEFSHSVKTDTGEINFYKLTINVARMSSAVDEIPVIIEEEKLNMINPDPGDCVEIRGEVREHNYIDENKKLKTFVYIKAHEMKVLDEVVYKNEVWVEGIQTRATQYRRTNKQFRLVADYLMAIPQPTRIAKESKQPKREYIPVIVWGLLAKVARQHKEGDQFKVFGRFQSRRFVRAKEPTKDCITYEISTVHMSKLMEDGTYKRVDPREGWNLES